MSVYRHLAPEESVAATVTEEMAQLKRSAYAQLFQCPAASPLPGGNPMPAESISMGGHRYTFQHFLPLDYALNAGLMGFHHDARHAHRRLRGQLARAGDASRVMLLGDADPSMLTASTFTWSPGLEDHGPFTLADAHGNPAMSGVGQASLDLLRHAGQVNVVFADGHARSVRIDGESLGQVHLLPQQD